MKWDFKTDPPTAWKVEDGDWVKIKQNDIARCTVCETWYVRVGLREGKSTCTSGCQIRENEMRVANQ
jgi:hypothetical protein